MRHRVSFDMVLHRRLWIVAAGLCPLLAAGGPAAASTAELAQLRSELAADYGSRLEELADWCTQHDLGDLAAQSRGWIPSHDPLKLALVALGGSDSSADAPPDEPQDVRTWRERFLALRKDQAEELFRLARTAMRQGRVSLAYELVLEVLREDPDHEASRRLLGFARYRGGWHTPYEIRKLRSGSVWHERFGWLPAAHVNRYEQGQRYFNGRWLSADEEARLRQRLKRPWQVESEHYQITTTAGLEAAVHLGVRLERLYRAWRQLFARYYTSADQLARLFEGRAPPRAIQRRHQVVYFRNREEYQQAIRGAVPAGVETIGIYLGDRRTAFFFADDAQDDVRDDSTLYHEATHQLFSEGRLVVPDVGGKANFWVIEAVACYMESLTETPGGYTLGGRDAVRLQDAVYRRLEDDFHIPLAELATWGMDRFQQVDRFENDVRLPMLYSQSAGLAHFLMHYDDGRYRDALVAYLLAVYTGRDRPTTLVELTGVAFAELDRQHRVFLEAAR